MEKEIVNICGWCPGAKERTMVLVKEGKQVSHGMCDDCQAKMAQQAEDREAARLTR